MIHPVRSLLHENAGIDAQHCEGPGFEALCAAERRRLGAGNDEELAGLLRADDAALHAFVAHIAVPETWFFRYPASFEALRAHLALRGRPARIASIGCATGQEAYSVAAAVLASGPGLAGSTIDAYDRNPRAIDAARRGAWSGSLALRGTVPQWAQPWISVEGDAAHAHPDAKALVTFHHVGSAASMLAALRGRCHDIILCRNVLIYLDESTRRSMMAAIAASLTPGGLLMLGHAERTDLGADWTRSAIAESFAWLKTSEAAAPLPPAAPQPRASASTPASERARTSSAAPATGTPAERDRRDALVAQPHAQAPSTQPSLDDRVTTLMQGAEAAMAGGDLGRALGLLEQVVYLAPQHDLAMLALAACCDGLGRPDDAQRWRRRAQRAASNRGSAS